MAKVERTVSIHVDVAQAKKDIELLKNEIKELREQLRELSKESVEYGVIAAKLAEVNKKLATATKELNNAVKQQIDLTKELNKSKSDADKAEEQRIKRQQHQKKVIEDLEKQIKELTDQLARTSSGNKDYAEILDEIKRKQSSLKDAQDKYTSSMRDSEKQTKSSTDASKSMSDKLDELSAKQKQANEQIKKTPDASTALNKNSEAMRDAAKQAKDSNMSMDAQGKTIEQLKKEFRDLKKAIESTVPGSKEHLKLIDDLKKKQDELNLATVDYDRALGKQRKSLGGINENFKFTGQSLGELKQLQKQLNKEILELPTTSPEFKAMAENIRLVETTVRDYQRELKGTKSLQQNIEDALKNSGQAAKSSERNIEDLTRSLNELRAAQKKVGANTKEFKDIEKAVNEVNDALEKEKKIADDVAKSLGKQESTFTKISNGFKQSIGAIPGLIAANLGADALKDFIGSSLEASNEINKIRQELILLGESGETVDETTSRVRALSETFDQDYKEVLKSVNAVSNQFSISTTDALSLIEDGFISGADAQGEFSAILSEYPAKFAQAGVSAQQFIDVTTASQQAGIFSDKGVDLIGEFGIRIREQTQATRDALTNAFGEQFTNKLLKDVADGTVSTVDAFNIINDELKTVGITAQEQETLVADVFSSAAENIQFEDLQQLSDVLKTQGEGYKELNEDQQAVVEGRRQLLESNQQLQSAFAELAEVTSGQNREFQILKNEIQATLIQGLASALGTIQTIIKLLWDFKEVITVVTVALVAYRTTVAAQKGVGFAATILSNVKAVGAFIKSIRAQILVTRALTIEQIKLNLQMLLNPVGLIVAGVAALIAIIGVLITKYGDWDVVMLRLRQTWEFVKEGFIKAFKIITWQFQLAWIVIKNFGKFIIDLFKGELFGIFNELGTLFKSILSFDTEAIKQSLGKLGKLFEGVFEKLKKFASNVWKDIKDGFLGIFDFSAASKEADKLAKEFEKKQKEIKKKASKEQLVLNFDIKPFQESIKGAEGNLEELRKVLKSLQDEQKKFTPDDQPYKDLQKEITGVVDKINVLKGVEEKEAEAAAKRWEKLQKAISKLRLEAEIELVGGEDTLDAIAIFRERAIKELRKEEGFSFLNPEEQEALLNKVNKIYDEKVKQLGANTIKEQEETLNEQLDLQLWFLEQQEMLLDRQRDAINASFEDSLEDQELVYDKQLFNLNNRLEEEQKAIEQLNKDFEDGLISASEFEKRSKELIDVEKKTLAEIADLEIEKIKTQQAGTELQIQTQMELMDQEAKIFKERIANERKFLEAKIALQPGGQATQEQIEQRQKLLDAEKDFDQKQLIDKEKLNNRLEKSRFDSSKAIVNIQKGLNAAIGLLNKKQKENTEKAADDELTEEEKKWKRKEDLYRRGAEAIQSALDTISQLQVASIEREIEQSQRRIDSNDNTIAQLESSQEGASERQKERIDKQIKVIKKSNEEETKNIEKAERERTEIERRKFIVSQSIAVADVVINTAQAIQRAVKLTPETFGLPFSAFAAASGAAQVAAIVAQTVSAKFAEGGIYQGGDGQGGVVFGRRHAQGGIHMNGGRAELEDGEIILTRNVYLDPTKRAIASALNQSAGGVGFAKGGVYSNINSMQLTPRLTASKFEFGGLYRQKFQGGGVVLPDLMATQMNNKALVSGFKDALKDMPSPVVTVEEINTAQSNVAVIEDNVI